MRHAFFILILAVGNPGWAAPTVRVGKYTQVWEETQEAFLKSRVRHRLDENTIAYLESSDGGKSGFIKIRENIDGEIKRLDFKPTELGIAPKSQTMRIQRDGDNTSITLFRKLDEPGAFFKEVYDIKKIDGQLVRRQTAENYSIRGLTVDMKLTSPRKISADIRSATHHFKNEIDVSTIKGIKGEVVGSHVEPSGEYIAVYTKNGDNYYEYILDIHMQPIEAAKRGEKAGSVGEVSGFKRLTDKDLAKYNFSKVVETKIAGRTPTSGPVRHIEVRSSSK